jgi:hypothetical protein
MRKIDSESCYDAIENGWYDKKCLGVTLGKASHRI